MKSMGLFFLGRPGGSALQVRFTSLTSLTSFTSLTSLTSLPST